MGASALVLLLVTTFLLLSRGLVNGVMADEGARSLRDAVLFFVSLVAVVFVSIVILVHSGLRIARSRRRVLQMVASEVRRTESDLLRSLRASVARKVDSQEAV